MTTYLMNRENYTIVAANEVILKRHGEKYVEVTKEQAERVLKDKSYAREVFRSIRNAQLARDMEAADMLFGSHGATKTEAAPAAAGGEEAAKDYDQMDRESLRALAVKRGLVPEDARPLKKDLLVALKAADADGAGAVPEDGAE